MNRGFPKLGTLLGSLSKVLEYFGKRMGAPLFLEATTYVYIYIEYRYNIDTYTYMGGLGSRFIGLSWFRMHGLVFTSL